jgi:hypothetical protein
VALAGVGKARALIMFVHDVEAFHDDVDAIPDETLLYRRVDWDKIGGREKAQVGVPATINGNCFRDYPDAKAREKGLPGPCMSVGAGNVIEQRTKKPSVMLDGYEGYGLALVRAGDLRNLRKADGTPCPQGVMWCPTDDEPWHSVIFDIEIRPRVSSVCKKIAQAASWEIPLIRDTE